MSDQQDRSENSPGESSQVKLATGSRQVIVERLVREHHGELYRFAYRLSGSQADAEDITQQTFLTAHAKLDQLRDEARVRPWLYSIARSCFLKSRRKASAVSASSVSLEMDELPASESPGDDVDRERLGWALAQLPDESRVILNMFYFEDASYREIAETIGIRIGTVMSRLSRAKEKLRRLLLEDGPSGRSFGNGDDRSHEIAGTT